MCDSNAQRQTRSALTHRSAVRTISRQEIPQLRFWDEMTTRHDLMQLVQRTPYGLVLVLTITGCGLEVYEQRLAATQRYYSYLDRIDQNLAPAWRNPPIDEIRVPKNFKEIPAPQPEKNPDGSLEVSAIDPRQPDYLNFTVEGLLAAWRSDVEVFVDGARLTKPAYLYAASNSALFLADQIEGATKFSTNFVINSAAALQAPIPDPKNHGRLELPKGDDKFVQKQSFDHVILNSELPIHDSRYTFEIYSTQQADNQVVVMLVVPVGMEPSSKISERMQLTLESLKVSAQRPQAKQAGAAGAPAGPTPSSGNF